MTSLPWNELFDDVSKSKPHASMITLVINFDIAWEFSQLQGARLLRLLFSFQLYQRHLKFKFKRSLKILLIKPNWSAYLILLPRSIKYLNFKIKYSNNHWQKILLPKLSRSLQKLPNLRLTKSFSGKSFV